MNINFLTTEDATGEGFENCNYCSEPLEGRNYIIEKVCKKTPGTDFINTIYEFAICEKCARDIEKEISEESRKYMMEQSQNMRNSVDMKGYGVTKGADFDIDMNCLISEKPFEEVEEFRISCSVQQNIDNFGTKLVFPMMINSDEVEDMQEGLSEETKDFFNRLKDDLISTPPGYEDIFNRTPVLIM